MSTESDHRFPPQVKVPPSNSTQRGKERVAGGLGLVERGPSIEAKPVGERRSVFALAQLGTSDRLLAWSLRSWFAGPDHWNHVWREFRGQCGASDAAWAMSGLERAVAILRESARRPWIRHRPCCPCLDAAELCLISAAADCQRFDIALAKLRANWLVRSPAATHLVEALQVLSGALLASDLILRGGAKD